MKRIDVCVFELSEWVRNRPYSKHIEFDRNTNSNPFMSNQEATALYGIDDTTGEIHCCIGIITEAIVKHKKFEDDYFDDLKIENKIFEHIENILKKHKIKSISLGNNLYVYNNKNKNYKIKNKTNNNL